MNNWPEYPEYNDINNQIELITKQIDSTSDTISKVVARTGNEPDDLVERYNILCDKRMRLIEKRHEIAAKCFP